MPSIWIDAIHILQQWAIPIAIGSGALLLLSLILTPYIVAKIPADYFAHHERHTLRESMRHPILELTLVSIKNILGALLLILGIIMLLGPGPGMITIIFSFSIMNFPGKYRLERWIIHRPMVLQGINQLRKKHGQPPLITGA